MIIEMQTQRRFCREYVRRRAACTHWVSPPAAFWRTEVGALNQIMTIWPYGSADERDHVRAAESKIAGWPPELRDHMLTVTAPFSSIALIR